jgi:hypothetical protein
MVVGGIFQLVKRGRDRAGTARLCFGEGEEVCLGWYDVGFL